jgi:putative hydrolase of the HAD superfamily
MQPALGGVMPISIVGLDADDTLWHNESYFRMTQQRFNELLADFAEPVHIETRLAEVERRNLRTYGYGAKGFTLSMLETALEVSGARVSSAILAEILAAGRELMHHPVEPLPGVRDALEILAKRHRLVLITKGDLIHQESKLAASGLGGFFSGVEIVSDKLAYTYRRVFSRHGADPDVSVMAGNSIRSDILPALEAGSFAAWIPYPLVWEHEAGDAPKAHPRFRELQSLGELAGWIDTLG